MPRHQKPALRKGRVRRGRWQALGELGCVRRLKRTLRAVVERHGVPLSLVRQRLLGVHIDLDPIHGAQVEGPHVVAVSVAWPLLPAILEAPAAEHKEPWSAVARLAAGRQRAHDSAML